MTKLQTTKIEAVIFDLFGVIVAFDDLLVYGRIAQHCSNPASAAEHMRDLVSEPSLIRGRTTLKQLHAQLVFDLGLTSSLQEFETMWSTSYSEPMPGIRDLIRQLSNQCRLVLLSNVDPYYWPTVEASVPELQYFHAKVLSFNEGVAKPDPMAFERAVEASGVATGKCYFVDDKVENTVAAAKIGLAGHTFLDCRALKESLRQVGLRME